MKYVTEVNPGSGLVFANSQLGFKVDGRQNVPYDYGNLSSGVGGRQIIWPGNSVSLTTDGGISWTTVLSPADGVWGIDVASDMAVVVGVDQIFASHNSGMTWFPISEPSAHPLVRVAFVDQVHGAGIDTTGSVLLTSDGGKTWQFGGLTTSTAAVCGANDTIYVANGDGSVLVSRDAGVTWHSVYQFSRATSDESAWFDMSCGSGGQAAATATYFSTFSARGPRLAAASGGATPDSWVATDEISQGYSGAELGPTNTPVVAEFPANGSVIRMSVSLNQGLLFSQALPGDVRFSSPTSPAFPAGNAWASGNDVGSNVLLLGAAGYQSSSWVQIEATASGKGTLNCIATSRTGGQSWQIEDCTTPQATSPLLSRGPKFAS